MIVGGGPTGVESAGALAELYRTNLAKDYPDVPQDKSRLILVEASDSLLDVQEGPADVHEKALEKRTVEVMLGEVVEKIEPTRVHLKSGTVIDAHTLVWGAGLQANPLATTLGLDLQHGNRVAAGPDLSLPDRPEVFVAGDIGWITDTKTKEVLPQLGSVALQAGEHAGENIGVSRAGHEALQVPRQGDDGDDRPEGRRRAMLARPHGADRVARMGRGASRAPVHRRGPGSGGRRLDVGRVHARSGRPDRGG